MPRIYPAPAHDRTQTRSGAGGFTLIEIVAALAICCALLYACASALMASLRAEQTALHAQQLDLACERLAALRHAGFDPAATDIGAAWTPETIRFDGKEWTVCRVSGEGRLAASVDFRQ